jgi:S-adenosyl-L-methionine methyltransferase
VSRLDSFIRRLEAQRRCLNHVAELIAGLEGPVIELGLGNGRTFDHLRELMPNRAVFAFDRQLSAHPLCVPSGKYFIEGDFLDTLPAARARIGGPAALCHADIGSGDEQESAVLARMIAPMIDRLMAVGGIVLGDQPMTIDRWVPLPLPNGVETGRYFLYRVG